MAGSGDIPLPPGTTHLFQDILTSTYSPLAPNVTHGYQSPSPPYWDMPTRIIFAILISALIVAAVVGNILVILVIARNRGMQTRTNIFLCNLAVSDLACALLDMPISLVTIIAGEWVFNDVVCQLNGFTTTLFMATSIHTLMYISIHKYLSIRNPFIRGFRRKWICTMLAAAWLWATILGYLTVHGLNHVSYKPYMSQCGPEYPHDPPTYAHFGIALGTCYVIPVCIMTGCYIGVFCEMKAHSERLQKNTTIEKDRVLQQQRRIAVTIFFVMATVILCWLPYNIFSIYVISLDDQDKVLLKSNPFVYLFCYVNNAVNPIIYALRSGAFREGYKQIICWRTTEYWPSDHQYNSVMRKFSRMRSMLRESLEAQLIDTTSRNGSLPCSRRNSSNSLATAYAIGKGRAISTSSLPQHLTYGTPLSLTRKRQSKLNSVKRGTLKTFLRLFSRSSGKEAFQEAVENGQAYSAKSSPVKSDTIVNGQKNNLYNIPEITVSNLDELEVTEVLLHNPEHVDLDRVCWEQELEMEKTPDEFTSNVTPSVTPCFSAALASGVNIMIAGLMDPEPAEHTTSVVPEFQYASSETSSVSFGMGSPAISISVDSDQAPEESVNDEESRTKSPGLLSPYSREESKVIINGNGAPKKMSKCASAPLLDKQGEEHDNMEDKLDFSHRTKHTLGHLFKSSFRRPTQKKDNTRDKLNRSKSEKLKKLKRFPSVERLDTVQHKRPSKRKSPRQTHSPQHKSKSGIFDPTKARRTSEGEKIERKSWFMRENRIDIRNLLNLKHKDHRRDKPKDKLFYKELHIKKPALRRSISDPCMTFKMIEERAVVRATTKIHRQNTRRYRSKDMRRVQTATRDALQVMSCVNSFAVPDANADSRNARLRNEPKVNGGKAEKEIPSEWYLDSGTPSYESASDSGLWVEEPPKRGVSYQIGGEDLVIGPSEQDPATSTADHTNRKLNDVYHPLKKSRLSQLVRKKGVHKLEIIPPTGRTFEHSLSDPGWPRDEEQQSDASYHRTQSDSAYDTPHSAKDRWTSKGLFISGSGSNRETVL